MHRKAIEAAGKLGDAAADVAVAAREPGWWIDRAARAGLAARALVYATVGVLAGEVALGLGASVAGQKGAIVELAQLPLGSVLMVALALGFGAFAVWRILQAIVDTEHRGASAKGLAWRAGYAISGLVNAGLAWAAVRALIGDPDAGREHVRSWASDTLAAPGGSWLLGFIALSQIVFGAAQFQRAFAREEQREHHEEEMDPKERTWFDRATKVGFSARGALYILAGLFLGSAALNRDAGDARGIADLLREILHQPHGHVLLLLLSIGFLAYAAFAALSARYKRV